MKNKLFVIIIPILFICFDVLTGWVKAFASGTTDSSIMRKGLYHKLGEVLAIGFGLACEFAYPYIGITIEIPLASGIATYIVLMETASIVENLSIISPRLAKTLEKFFDPKKIPPEVRGAHEKDEDESADSD